MHQHHIQGSKTKSSLIQVIIIGYKTWDKLCSVGQLALMMTMLHHLVLMLNLFCSPAPVSCFQTHSNFEMQII